MKHFLVVAAAVLLVSATLSPSGHASTPITGTATSCSSLVSCVFSITTSFGTGSARTSAFVGGYVGQSPLPFSGGSVTFQLPGEKSVTYATNVLSGQAVLAGSSSTAGTLYNSTGTFAATDSNTGKVVQGSLELTVGIKGRSGRGGGNTYTLVSGSIVFNPTNQDGTTTTVTCNPSSVSGGQASTCTVNISDLASASSITTGQITWSYSNTLMGSLSNGTCTLASGSCSVNFLTNQEYGAGTTSIYASYSGDITHYASAGRTALYATVPSDVPGDVDGDGHVDLTDLVVVAVAFGSTPTSPNWNPIADLNNDGVIDVRDLAIVAAHFGM